MYEIIGDTWGSTDITFNVPDLRGRFPRGWGPGQGIDSGRIFGSYQGDAIRNINATFYSMDRGAFRSSDPNSAVYPASRWNSQMKIGGGDDWGIRYIFNASRVVPTANENRPYNIAIPFIIKAYQPK